MAREGEAAADGQARGEEAELLRLVEEGVRAVGLNPPGPLPTATAAAVPLWELDPRDDCGLLVYPRFLRLIGPS
eukprot:6614971-Pyramimonas_sp.AAC.1